MCSVVVIKSFDLFLMQRISALEDLCSRKDYKIFELKQELRALETKVSPNLLVFSQMFWFPKLIEVSHFGPPIYNLSFYESEP